VTSKAPDTGQADRQHEEEEGNMVPLLSRRCILILSLGLILGMLLGVGYWYISPVTVEAQPSWPPVSVNGLTDSPPKLYRSVVMMEGATQGASYVSTKSLQHSAEYWVYRMSTAAFYDYLIRDLAEEVPGFAESAGATHDALVARGADPLSVRMISARVRYGDPITRVEVNALGRTEEAALFLAGAIPQLFEEFLIAEEKALRQAEYEEDLLRIESLKSDLVEARHELAVLTSNGDSEYADLDSSRILAEAMAAALEMQMDSLSSALAALIAGGFTLEEEYANTMSQIERVSAELAKARNELVSLEFQMQGASSDTDYAIAYAKVNALVRELDELSIRVASPPSTYDVEEVVRGLFVTYDPTPAMVLPVDKIRGRNALMMGAVLGVGGAWLGLNWRALLRRLRSSSMGAASVNVDDEDKEDEE
jgi:hypothetical protein